MLLIADQDVNLYIHFPHLAQCQWANSHSMLKYKSNDINPFYINFPKFVIIILPSSFSNTFTVLTINLTQW